MIADGKIKPTLVVTPTFYPIGNTDDSVAAAGEQMEKFYSELVNDLIPAVEGMYSTYATSTDTKRLKASGRHRAFGGFSMGSVATWYQFIRSMDYFKYYLPMSGDCWAVTERGGETRGKETAKYLEDSFKKSGYGKNDFFIYAVTGSEDIAYGPMNGQIKAMKKLKNTFHFIDKRNQPGNIYFPVKKGGYRDYPDIREYIYNALPLFWK